jgi:hypothetical protein
MYENSPHWHTMGGGLPLRALMSKFYVNFGELRRTLVNIDRVHVNFGGLRQTSSEFRQP